MSSLQVIKSLSRLFILSALIACLWFFSDVDSARRAGAQNYPQSEQQMPILVSQLPQDDGIIPAQLLCGSAHLTAANTLNDFSCRLRNNTNKTITAVNLSYSILFAQNGNELIEKETHFITMEALTHPDFRETYKPVLPGREVVLMPAGQITYSDAVIRGVEAKVDYVEFEDKTTLGPNEEGSRIIGDLRSGAAKYKDWLAREYAKHGRSVTVIIRLLQKDSPMPTDLVFSSFYEESGARAYQNLMRKQYETHGAAEVEKHFQK